MSNVAYTSELEEKEFEKQEKISKEKYSNRNQIERKRTTDSDKVAEKIIRNTKIVERVITNDVKNTCERHGGNMFGLDFRMKTLNSISGKLYEIYSSNIIDNSNYTYQDAANSIKDSLRFTSVIKSEKFAEHIDNVLTELENNGYMITDFKNTYKNGSLYKGVNCNIRSSNGFIFELQFHTPESLEKKEQYVSDGNGGFRKCLDNEKSADFPSHKYYEELRASRDITRIKYLKVKLIRLWEDVLTPKGLEKITAKWTNKDKDSKIEVGVK